MKPELNAEVEVSFKDLNGKTFHQYSIFNDLGEFQLAGDVVSFGKLKVSGNRIIARTKEIYFEIITSKIKDAYQDGDTVYIKTTQGVTITFHLDE